MRSLRFLLGDQLSRDVAALRDLDPTRDVVLMVEAQAEARHLQHHQQKIALVLSAMRHFADLLGAEGARVDYVHLDDPENTGTFRGELQRARARHAFDRIVVTEPGEWRVAADRQDWEQVLHLPVEIRPDTRFLCSRQEFADWAAGRRTLRLEAFYRTMRQESSWLMDGDQPRGGQWNYDPRNRRPVPSGVAVPPRLRFTPDPQTREVLHLVRKHFGHHFGDLEPFGWAVTRRDALAALHDFVQVALPAFGDYQDAMRLGEDWLFHSVLSPYLNLGLLDPREVCEAALAALESGAPPIHAVEGFVRQILGWREYVRGIYWRFMPEYASTNFLHATRLLPAFYWTGETDLRCLREVIQATRRHAYAHHIQRLMVTGNFALLAGLLPSEVEAWYRIAYADAFDWVELPNTHGMALFADGGRMASKPYAASGGYIRRMSDYCTAGAPTILGSGLAHVRAPSTSCTVTS